MLVLPSAVLSLVSSCCLENQTREIVEGGPAIVRCLGAQVWKEGWGGV